MMPALKFSRCFDTRPFADDDLHPVCLIFSVLRLLQLAGVVPLSVRMYALRWRGRSISIGSWHDCVVDASSGADDAGSSAGADDLRLRRLLLVSLTLSSSTSSDDRLELYGTSVFMTAYVVGSIAYFVADLALLASIWAAASVGTPTQPHGRDALMRPLLTLRVTAMNAALVALVAIGIVVVHLGRTCRYVENSPPSPYDGSELSSLEDTAWYALFCALLSTQALELLFLPVVVTNSAVRWLRRHDRVRGTDMDVLNRTERCLGGCLKCFGALSCFRAGGYELGADMKGLLRDSVRAMQDLFNDGGNFNMVASDVFLAFMMLSRVQRQRRYECIEERLRFDDCSAIEAGLEESVDLTDGHGIQATESRSVGETKVAFVTSSGNGAESDASNLSTHHDSSDHSGGQITADEAPGTGTNQPVRYSRRGSIFALDWNGEFFYRMLPRDILSPLNETDKTAVKEASRYIRHANSVYCQIPDLIAKRKERSFLQRLNELFREQPKTSSQRDIPLEHIGLHRSTLVHIQPNNGIVQTPYCITIDDESNAVVIAIRGTSSFEDIVVDLRLTPTEMKGVGKRCGFDGAKQFCHKGILSRCKWLYDDLERHCLLSELLLSEEPRCPGHKLVITGHSLGAGCAAVLSLMLRHRFPSLHCYAFCPPGGLLSASLADDCKPFVTSIVNDTDIVPRLSYENLEKLRDESLEVFARIKISKIKASRILRMSCRDRHLSAQNAKLLHDRADIPSDTTFYRTLTAFRELADADRGRGSLTRVALFPPGKILYLVRTNDSAESSSSNIEESAHTPLWAEKFDFNEMLLSPTALNDHSTTCVEENLEAILISFANGDEFLPVGGNGTSEDSSDASIDCDLVMDPSFSCCSYPQGKTVILSSVLASIALILTIVSTNWCVLLLRTTEMESFELPGSLPPGFGYDVSFGLWTYMPKIHVGDGPTNDPDSYIDSEYCHPYPPQVAEDSYLSAARVFATACLGFGCISVTSLWFASCRSYRRKVWIALCLALFSSACFQGLMFLVFVSSFCKSPFLDVDGRLILMDASCALAWGSRTGIAAIALWLSAAFLTATLARNS